MEKIGLVPAAGRAARMQVLPCSKEILPVPFTAAGDHGKISAVAENLLARLRFAQCNLIYWVLNPNKLDIASYFSRKKPELALAYLVIEQSPAVPYTIDFAYPFTRGKRVMMGFADICTGPMDVFQKVERTLETTGADLALGLFPIKEAKTKKRSDMVELSAAGRVTSIQVKPEKSDLQYSWAMAIWQPRFTEFLHHVLKDRNPAGPELHLGDLFQQAISSGLTLAGHCFDGHTFIDIGTPESWSEILRSENIVKACQQVT